jgi:hypothetical protein
MDLGREQQEQNYRVALESQSRPLSQVVDDPVRVSWPRPHPFGLAAEHVLLEGSKPDRIIGRLDAEPTVASGAALFSAISAGVIAFSQW